MATPQGVSGRWWDERLGLTPLTLKLLRRHVPSGLSWWYSLGAATLFVLSLQFLTGILLALNYGATPADAYDSVQYVANDVPFGWFIRGLHHWGGSAMIALVVVHMASSFVLGAHRSPREATWLAGVVLLLCHWHSASPGICCRGTRRRTGPPQWAQIWPARCRSSVRRY
jgi:ubiquinol-cytochrome c reductase cytochrome b subunit